MKAPIFKTYADLAMGTGELTGLRPVVEKELLHYEILNALVSEGILENLCFQGGTALRLCHGGIRYSEDLDFSAGPGFTDEKAGDLAGAIQRHIGEAYELPVTVKPPKAVKAERADPIRVSTWSIRIETAPQARNMPSQRIKIDIDTTVSHTREQVQPRLNYDFLPSSYAQMILPVQSMSEIMANKLVALPSSIILQGRPRYRDIWDLRWLSQRNVMPDPIMVLSKAAEHGITDIQQVYSDAIEGIQDVVLSEDFRNEMSRFLPGDVRRQTLENPAYLQMLAKASSDLLQITLSKLRGDPAPGSSDFAY